VKRIYSFALLFGLIALTPAEAPSCGPYSAQASFVPEQAPGVAMVSFLAASWVSSTARGVRST
jgi:hypothetical protein